MPVLHLNGHVANLVVFQQISLNALQQPIVVMRRDHLRMQRHQLLFADLPDMHVMDVAHFRDIQAQVFCSLAISTSCGVPSNSSWKLSFSSRRAAQHQTGDQHRQDRVNRGPAGGKNDDGGDDGAH